MTCLRNISICLALMGGAASAQEMTQQDCSVALAFALDVSVSVDDTEYELQRTGLAASLADKAVTDLILSHHRPVLLMAYEWSGSRQQSIIAPWSLIGSEADIASFARRVLDHPRMEREYPTALGPAIGFGALRLHDVSACSRLVLDISGDGASNDGFPPDAAYRHFPVAGITVNGLVIQTGGDEVVEYYVEHIIHGPGAFVEIAYGFEDYAEAMKRKLLRELQPQQFANR